MKTKDVGSSHSLHVKQPIAKAPPKTGFGAALAEKQAQLAQEQQAQQGAQREQEVLEQVAMQMSRSVLDAPKAANIESDKAESEEETSDGW